MVHILNFQRDLVVVWFIHIGLIVSQVKYKIEWVYTSKVLLIYEYFGFTKVP